MFPTRKEVEEDKSDTSESSHPEYSSESSDQEDKTLAKPHDNKDCSSVDIKSPKPSVKDLVGHFSLSDSDTGGAERSTRRKSSKYIQHTELPSGGERELKRNIKMQEAANKAKKAWDTLSREFKEDLIEAQKSLDVNHGKGILKGHLAGLSSAAKHAWDSLTKLLTFEGKSDVSLDFEDIRMHGIRLEKQYKRVKAHLDENCEPEVKIKKETVKEINPMKFGDLKLPDFHGDYTEYAGFETNFRKLMEAAGKMSDDLKATFLLDKVKGEAREYLGSDGIEEKTYEEIWTELRSRYGKPWRVTRASVKKYNAILTPSDDPREVSKYWNQMIESCKTAERLGLTATSIILNTALLGLPGDYRKEMDDKLKLVSKDYKLTREIVAEPFNDVIAGQVAKSSRSITTLGFNTVVGTNGSSNNSGTNGSSNSSGTNGSSSGNNGSNGGNNGHKNNYKKNWKGKGNRGNNSLFCLLCNGKANHKTGFCPVYSRGQKARERMRVLGRCIACSTLNSEHGAYCSHRVSCRDHPGQHHSYWLCDGKPHPGWQGNSQLGRVPQFPPPSGYGMQPNCPQMAGWYPQAAPAQQP